MTLTEDLDAEMRNLLARMACISYGTTQSWNSTGGGAGEGGDPRPPGGGRTLHETWAATYNKAPDDHARGQCITKARAALVDELGHAPSVRPVGETPEQETARQAARVKHLDRDGIWSTADIANDVRLTIGQVKRIIAAAALEAPAPARDEPRAIEMYRSGKFTLRQIERTTNVPKETVRRLGRSAA